MPTAAHLIGHDGRRAASLIPALRTMDQLARCWREETEEEEHHAADLFLKLGKSTEYFSKPPITAMNSGSTAMTDGHICPSVKPLWCGMLVEGKLHWP